MLYSETLTVRDRESSPPESEPCPGCGWGMTFTREWGRGVGFYRCDSCGGSLYVSSQDNEKPWKSFVPWWGHYPQGPRVIDPFTSPYGPVVIRP